MSPGGFVRDLHFSIDTLQKIISKRWVSEILFSINHRHHRYTEILNCIPYISSTELRRKLKSLLKYGLILKDEQGEYHLTLLGKDMIDIMIKASMLAERMEKAKKRHQ